MSSDSMIAQFFSLGLIALLGAMLPGPDFAIVTKNTILHSRKSGYFTSLGIGAAILVHMTYCLLGMAIVIKNSLLVFNTIKYIGAAYLVYLGVKTFFSKQSNKIFSSVSGNVSSTMSSFTAFKQGFLCNLLNPKATLFFLSLFTVLIKPDTPISWQIVFAGETILIAITWFCLLTQILSHPYIKGILEKAETYIAKILGCFLIFFGVALALVSRDFH